MKCQMDRDGSNESRARMAPPVCCGPIRNVANLSLSVQAVRRISGNVRRGHAMPTAPAPEIPTVVLDPGDCAPALARRFLADQFREWGSTDDYVGRLVVCELVTNACRHGEGSIIVRLFRDARPDLVVIEVWDRGEGLPVIGPENFAATSGRGLAADVPSRARLGNPTDPGRRKDRLGQMRPLSSIGATARSFGRRIVSAIPRDGDRMSTRGHLASWKATECSLSLSRCANHRHAPGET
ncbi:ATP-binding protein [Actinomadura madurae]|uniref:ATP-binding protein n=1 Tax=Actinomadura madurae TaxID=1993 RepID=UPI003D6BD037